MLQSKRPFRFRYSNFCVITGNISHFMLLVVLDCFFAHVYWFNDFTIGTWYLLIHPSYLNGSVKKIAEVSSISSLQRNIQRWVPFIPNWLYNRYKYLTACRTFLYRGCRKCFRIKLVIFHERIVYADSCFAMVSKIWMEIVGSKSNRFLRWFRKFRVLKNARFGRGAAEGSVGRVTQHHGIKGTPIPFLGPFGLSKRPLRPSQKTLLRTLCRGFSSFQDNSQRAGEGLCLAVHHYHLRKFLPFRNHFASQ